MSRSAIASIIIVAVALEVFAWEMNRTSLQGEPNNFIPEVVVETSSWQTFPAPPSFVDSSWKTLTDDALGIRIKVPQKIVTYNSIDDPAGCSQSLILGISSGTSVFLTPEYASCERNAASNRVKFQPSGLGFGSSPSAKLTVTPITGLAGIAVALRDEITNSLATAPTVVAYEQRQCELQPLKIIVPDVVPSGNGTVPVSIVPNATNVCPLTDSLVIQYSPQFKKVVFIEPGTEADANFADGDFGSVTNSIYGSVQVFK